MTATDPREVADDAALVRQIPLYALDDDESFTLDMHLALNRIVDEHVPALLADLAEARAQAETLRRALRDLANWQPMTVRALAELHPQHADAVSGARDALAQVPPSGRVQTCPKCNGQGHVNTPPWVPGDQQTYMAADTSSHVCRVCGGSGVYQPPSTDFPGQPSGRGDTITTVSPGDACPCCGSAVRVHTADEGTCSYEAAVTAATIETVRAEAEYLLVNFDRQMPWDAARSVRRILAALPPEPRIRTIGDLTRAMTEAGLEPPDECA